MHPVYIVLDRYSKGELEVMYTDEEIIELFRNLSPNMQKAIHDIMLVTTDKVDDAQCDEGYGE